MKKLTDKEFSEANEIMTRKQQAAIDEFNKSTCPEKMMIGYMDSTILAFKEYWTEIDGSDKPKERSKIICYLINEYYIGGKLNLGECNDGSKFTAVRQAVNEAKWLVGYRLGVI